MRKHKVRFDYKGDMTVQKVSIAGTFNAWDHTKNYFVKNNSGDYSIEINIPTGRHFYKFVINDTEWILDPNNGNISEDGQNNSSITITEDGKKFIRSNKINKKNPSDIYKKYNAVESPEWLKKAVIYQLSFKAFSLDGISGAIKKLKYLKELGISVIWLMPFWETGIKNRQGTDGDPYAVWDFYKIDKTTGQKDEIKEFVSAAHRYDIKVIFDIPINRMAIDNVLVNEHEEYFTHNSDGEIYYNVPGRESFAGFNFESEDLASYMSNVINYWIKQCDFDGIRLDDSDITPLDFLLKIKERIEAIKDEFIIISQSYDEYHHISFCNLTYDGFLRQAIKDISENNMTKDEFIDMYEAFKYSFPRGALRMRWFEEKETSRIYDYFKEELLYPAIAFLFTFDGVPALMMGQEYNETSYNTYESLFNKYTINWENFNQNVFRMYKKWIGIRNKYEALWNGETKFIDNPYDKVISFIRSTENQNILIIINLGEKIDKFSLMNILNEEICIEAYDSICIKLA